MDRIIAATKLYYKRGLSVTLNWKSEDIEKCSLGLAVIEPDRIPVSSDLYLFWEHFLLYGITYLTDMQMATSLGYLGNNGYAGTSFDKKTTHGKQSTILILVIYKKACMKYGQVLHLNADLVFMLKMKK